MKQIILGVAFGAMIATGLGFATSVGAAAVGKSIVQSAGLWGYVDGGMKTSIYKIADPDNKTVCYVAYYGANAVPDMECVK